MMCSITCYQHVRSSSTTRASLTAYVGGVVVKLDVGNLVGVLAIDYFHDIDYINIINDRSGRSPDLAELFYATGFVFPLCKTEGII